MMQISLKRHTIVFEPRQEISNNMVGATSKGSDARLSQHLSKCHIVGNHMSWLICHFSYIMFRSRVSIEHFAAD